MSAKIATEPESLTKLRTEIREKAKAAKTRASKADDMLAERRGEATAARGAGAGHEELALRGALVDIGQTQMLFEHAIARAYDATLAGKRPFDVG